MLIIEENNKAKIAIKTYEEKINKINYIITKLKSLTISFFVKDKLKSTIIVIYRQATLSNAKRILIKLVLKDFTKINLKTRY